MPERPGKGEAPTAETASRTPENAPTPMGPVPGSGGDAASLSPGQVLNDRYWIQRLLGRGGMGEVWQAVDLKLRVDVALKSLHPELHADEGRRELLRQEVRSAREVISPNACRVYDLVELDGQELLSMEHIDGETLLALLREHAPLPLTEARDLALQFLSGLDAIHAAGLVHRDFKPENVMITRSGRVVVMDFGLALKTASGDGSVAGTPAYMAPEQSRGQAVDARTDLYAVGVVLAEMVSEAGVRDRSSRKSVWDAIHEDPPRIPDSPWTPVIRKAVARDPAERPGSAQALIRALQEITLRVEGAEEKHPYPGLASFTEEDAEHFFGREAEVESILRTLRRAHLLALVGPSGAGKSSFLRAGLVPALPPEWAHVYCQPGEQPFASLGWALARALSRSVVGEEHSEEPQAIVDTARRWREGHDEALVVLDQFEELFTLNAEATQARFADLVGRLVREADVRVLVSLRDDFLFQCHVHEALAPVASELTLLGPPAGAALSRALVQPALSLGYRFEDEGLVMQMLEEVSRERGALPLLAFAAASLWEHRDPEEGLLTRAAYETIGGVGGALARHAEATLEKIGRDREPVVRELFRNLVTARGTRAVRERDELLSVFDDAADAEEVLGELIGARLLTSFEAHEPARDTGAERVIQRIEVIHESLLSAWPRLVRWQTQDAESAQLRDQLRQAARLWDERGRPEEMLWTGASFLEYRAWRERYPGGLTALEADFTDAMVSLAGRRRGRRRLAVGAAFATLLAALATFGTLWRRSEAARAQTEVARQEAVAEARRAEASKLLALGRLELDEDPTAAFAYGLKSLELTDSPEARRFELEALWRGPLRFVVSPTGSVLARFSPDGEWVLWKPTRGPVLADSEVLWVQPRDGGEPHRLGGDGGAQIVLSPDSRLLVSAREESTVLDLRSFPDGKTLRTLELDGPSVARFTDEGRSLLTLTGQRGGDGPAWEVRLWPLEGSGSTVLGRVPLNATVDESGRWLAWARGPALFLQPVEALGRTTPRPLWRHDRSVLGMRLQPGGDILGLIDAEGRPYVLWPGQEARPLPGWPEKTALQTARFNSDGSLLAASARDNLFRLWDLAGPPGALPILIQPRESHRAMELGFDPSSQWLVTSTQSAGTAIWPLRRRQPWLLPTDGPIVGDLAFTPDSRSLVGGSSTTVWLWPLAGDEGASRRPLLEGKSRISRVKLDSTGRRVAAGFNGGEVLVRDLGGGPIRRLEGFRGRIEGLTFSRDGRFVAASGGMADPREEIIRVWDLETGEVRVVNPEGGQLNWILDATERGELLSAGPRGVRVWSFLGGEPRLLHAGSCEAVLEHDDRYLLVWCNDPWGGARYDLVDGTSGAVDLRSHPREIYDMALDPTGRTVVTAGPDPLVRVGPVTGEEPHLLMGHEQGTPRDVEVSPDGRWIASGGSDGTIRLWPMPEGPPLHTLPYDELLARLRSLTNVRVVEDDGSPTGYVLGDDPFPGWATVPEW